MRDIESQSKLEWIDYFIWRPVFTNPPRAQLWELDSHWTFDDLVVFHEMQDIIEAMEEERALEAQKPNT
jgi:hypothetical protein